MNKKVKYIVVGMLLVAIVGFMGVHFIAPYGITQPPRLNANFTPQELGLQSETVQITSDDNHKLNGYWIKSSQSEPKGVTILVHGIGGCKEHFLGLAKELSFQGIESVLFDSRAHGKSEGEFCTYGYKERNDISKIVDHIKSKKPNLKIGIWGNSLGGAIAIQALEIEKRIEFGIIESTFTELDKIVFDYKKRILKGIGIKAVSNYALFRSGILADFDPDKVKPIQSVTNIEQPIFLAHGDADENISVEYAKELFKNLKSKDKELYIVKDGGHFGLFNAGGADYKMNINSFIERNFN